MKTIIIILLAGLLFGCQREPNPFKDIAPVIIWKRNDTFGGKQLPVGICRFGYRNETSYTEFMDSYHKYHVMDTIVGKKVTY